MATNKMIFTPFIEITTASYCAVDCVFCPQRLYQKKYQSNSPKPIKYMSMVTFKKIIDWVPKDFEVRFSGFVEPFMNKECAEMILYAHQAGKRISIFTTLMGVNLKDLQKIMTTLSFKKNKDSLIVHLPSIGALEHFVINKSYLENLQYLLSIDGDNIDFHYHGKQIEPEVEKIVLSSKRKVFFTKLISRSGNVNPELAPTKKELKGRIRCTRPDMHEHVILPNGDIALCCNDFGMKHILGNISDGSYQELHSNEKMKNVIKGQDDESLDILCRRCEFAATKELVEETSKDQKSLAEKRKLLETWRILQNKKNINSKKT